MMPGPDFVVLTGFLGSGKTTLLLDFLGLPGSSDTGVIVNEVGEIGLDGALLQDGASRVPLTMLANGCVCCQLGSDLALTLDGLLAADRPQSKGPLKRIILETSGLSKPGPILRQLAQLAEHRMPVSVVATYDAVHAQQAAAFGEAAAQWAGANAIVVTKTDLVGDERVAHALGEAGMINPLAEIIASRDRQDAMAAFTRTPARGMAREPPCGTISASSHPRVTILLVRPQATLRYDDLAYWLDNFAGLLGERLLRLKGLLRVVEADHPVLIQSVGTVFSAPRPFRGAEPGLQSFLVVIARDLDPAELDALKPTLPLTISRWLEPRPLGARRPTRPRVAEPLPPAPLTSPRNTRRS
jgi:G3E family GTPase